MEETTQNQMHYDQMPDEPKKKDFLKDAYDFVELFALAACIIVILFTFLFRLSVVDGTSMQKTLEGGDRLILTSLFYEPKVGDIVVVQSPNVDEGKPIVKRVIATEGQRVEIKADGVYVYNPDGSGGKLEETDGSLGYTVDFSGGYYPFGYKYTPMSLTLGEGMIFVMGDHRSVSLDSRSFGPVDERTVVGKVVFRISPLSAIGTVK